ncbi:hypothetical protein MTX38_31690, partial [Rhodococcus sp. ARC_M13]|nr:hypothetical protein [Rhodococcus sp. ARC_M13]
ETTHRTGHSRPHQSRRHEITYSARSLGDCPLAPDFVNLLPDPHDETAWWVDIKDWARPCHGSAVPKWEYQAHFPGIFTVDWVGWIYAQWIV